MPAMPPIRKATAADLDVMRCGQIVVECSSTPQPVTKERNALADVEIAEAATPKAKL
jgi:hypothetical protein